MIRINIENVTKNVTSWFEGYPQPPVKMDVFITEKCNLKCKFCNFPLLEKNNKELNKDELLKIVETAGELGVEVFSILGGEPFVRKDVILEMMKKIKKNNMDGSIVTNGTLLEEEEIFSLTEIGWDFIRFSVDGNEKTHDYLRGADNSYKKTTNSIELFKKYKKELGLRKPKIEINTVLCKRNYTEIIDVIKLAKKMECEHVFILPMIEFTEKSKKLKIDHNILSDVKGELKKAEKESERLGISTNLRDIIEKELTIKSNNMDEIILSEDVKKNDDYIPCFIPWYAININSNGYVTPCSQFNSKVVNIKDKSLEEIWYGEYFNDIRKKIKNKELPECCKRCCVPLVEENENIRKQLSQG